MQLQIIYTETDVFLTKHTDARRRNIQDVCPDYKTSLGTWEHDEVIGFLADEYSKISPSAEEQALGFLSSPEHTKSVTFSGASHAV